jgi:hypothetical protein
MQSARHKTLKNAIKYKKDADFLLELAKHNNDEFAIRISKFKSIYVENFQLGSAINELGSYDFKPLDELAVHFIEQLCGVNRDSLQFSIPYTWDKVIVLLLNVRWSDSLRQNLLKKKYKTFYL